MLAKLVARIRGLTARARHPWRIPVDGLDRLPEGAVIVACNRVGPFDHLNVASSLGRQATVVIQPESGLQPIPRLRRTSWTTDLDSPDHPATVLDRDEALVVFPEAAAGNDGAVHKGHAEFAALAVAHRAPIVPAALVPMARSETDTELRYRLRIGEAINVDRYAELTDASDTTDGLILRGLADLVMSNISELAGRRYRDDYTRSRRAGQGVLHGSARSEEARQARAERRAIEQQRRAAEAELARELDEQETARLAEAAEAARLQAERAAAADEEAMRARRQHQS